MDGWIFYVEILLSHFSEITQSGLNIHNYYITTQVTQLKQCALTLVFVEFCPFLPCNAMQRAQSCDSMTFRYRNVII